MPQKILLDLDKLTRPNCGLGNVAINFGNELLSLSQSDFEWEVLISDKEGMKNLSVENIAYRKLTKLNKKNILPFDRKVDLVHLTNQMTKYYVSNGKPNILTIHDLNFLFEEEEVRAAKMLKRIQEHVNNATLITVISNFTKQVVEENLDIPPTTDIRVVYNGVRSPLDIKAIKPSGDHFDKFFFTIGTVMPKKNFHTLIEMMTYIEDDYHLIIGGELSKKDYVKEINTLIKELQLQHRVHLIGTVSEEEKSYLYQHTEAFLFPSLCEGFGLPIIEAMYCGTPVVCSMKTSLPEIGSDKAYYWENFESKYMAETLTQSLVHFHENKELNVKILKQYASQFTWKENVQRYLSLYKEVLS